MIDNINKLIKKTELNLYFHYSSTQWQLTPSYKTVIIAMIAEKTRWASETE